MLWVFNLLAVALLLWSVTRSIETWGFGWWSGFGVLLIVWNTYCVGLGIREML